MCGKSRGLIADVENGRKVPSLKTLQIIADVLEAELYQLFVSENMQKRNYYVIFFLELKGNVSPKLFRMLDEFLKQ